MVSARTPQDLEQDFRHGHFSVLKMESSLLVPASVTANCRLRIHGTVDLLYLACLAALVLMGSGPVSLDRILKKRSLANQSTQLAV
jgi:hypothetical protein